MVSNLDGARDRGQKQTDVIIMDFAKAFDKVPHRRLLYKLDHYGIRGSTHKWISSWLSERSQKVVLGPTLFLIYINDLPDVVHNFVKLFADDAKLYSVVNTGDDASTVQEDLSRIDKWSDIWQIKFNYKKCNHMHLDKEQQFSTYFIFREPTKINQASEQNDLGVILITN